MRNYEIIGVLFSIVLMLLTGMPILISCRTLLSFVNNLEPKGNRLIRRTESTSPRIKPSCIIILLKTGELRASTAK